MAMEMISGDGVFNDKDLDAFMKLHECGVSYGVVAIMGPQGSGKSTVLNHLFHTNFPMKDGRSSEIWERKTRGIWISEASIMDPFTLVMDVEGTDGQERGEDGTAFEKQTTLFSLVVADVLIINMWYHDIGRVNAANIPLLNTIFQEMLQVFRSRPRKTTLQFVVRDRETESQIGDLQTKLNDDVQKIWEIVPKSAEFKNTHFSEIFNVEVDALSHYKYDTTRFKKEVVELRKKIQVSLRSAADRGGDVPTSGFSLNAKRLWEDIRQNKNLDLPTHKKMVATMRCEEIAGEKLRLFASDKEWLKAEAAAEKGLVPGFNSKISLILKRYLSLYDDESKLFEEGVRNSKRQNLETEAYKMVHSAFINTLDHLRRDALRKFETQLKKLLSEGGGFAESARTCQGSCELDFDRRCLEIAAIEEAKWDSSVARRELVRDMKNHARYVGTDLLSQVVDKHRARLGTNVTRHLKRIFKDCCKEGISWPSITSFVHHECDSAASDFRSTVAAFELDEETLEQKINDLKQSAKNSVVNKFKEETASVLRRMYESYTISWQKNEDPFPKCLKLLSNMAAIRLDESSKDDNLESLLLSILIDGGDDVSGNGNSNGGNPLASNTWDKIPPKMTLITPVGCKDTWIMFKQAIESAHKQIQSLEERECIQIPYWWRLGTWLLGVGNFTLLLCRQDYVSAAVAFPALAVQIKDLVGDFPKEEVKNGCKKMQGKYHQLLKKIKEALQRFYNLMKDKFTTKSKVKVSS